VCVFLGTFGRELIGEGGLLERGLTGEGGLFKEGLIELKV
jgi:hypothetical protein